MNKVTQRDAFWNKVYESAKKDRDIVIVTADMGAPALDRIRKELASQFVNVGIAEQNAITLAAGLALSKKKVFVYAIAPFITLRCLEQIRVEGAMMKIPMVIVGVGAGFGYEDSGPTHHLIEDIAVIRAFPNTRINSVTDNVMAEHLAAKLCSGVQGVEYVRLERKIFPDIYEKNADFSKEFSVIKESGQYYILSTGSMTHVAVDVSRKLKKNGIDAGVIDVFSLPVNGRELAEKLKKAKKIITLEEHFLPGGFGSAICEVLNDCGLLIPLKRLGLSMEKGYCYRYGGREEIRSFYDLSQESVYNKIKKFILTR